MTNPNGTDDAYEFPELATDAVAKSTPDVPEATDVRDGCAEQTRATDAAVAAAEARRGASTCAAEDLNDEILGFRLNGLKIVEVLPGSLSDFFGLRVGDTIQTVNGDLPPTTEEELHKAIKGRPLRLEVKLTVAEITRSLRLDVKAANGAGVGITRLHKQKHFNAKKRAGCRSS